jgi:origin recognition complex subunit 4
LSIQPEQLSVEERGILEGGTKSTPAKKGKKNDTTEDALSQWNANISVSSSTVHYCDVMTRLMIY